MATNAKGAWIVATRRHVFSLHTFFFPFINQTLTKINTSSSALSLCSLPMMVIGPPSLNCSRLHTTKRKFLHSEVLRSRIIW
jgi:hypothetical protein